MIIGQGVCERKAHRYSADEPSVGSYADLESDGLEFARR
jgi:hypothetical protein